MEKSDLILLIDDEFVSNLIMKKYLTDLGCSKYEVINNGKDAISYLEKLDTKPAFIFLDLRMPLVDGFEFLEHCMRQPNLLKDSRVYILTSSINPRDMDRAKEFECVEGFIQKPINPLRLKEILWSTTSV
jgi:CheY-like chemotaxis protein